MSTTTGSGPTLPNSTFVSPTQFEGGGPRQLVVKDLAEDFAGLAEQFGRTAAYLRAALRKVSTHHRQIGFCMMGRLGAETLQDTACIEGLNDSDLHQLKQTLNQNLLTFQGQTGTLLSGPHVIGQHQIYSVTIGVDQGEQNDLVGTFCFGLIPESRKDLEHRCAELRASVSQVLTTLPPLSRQKVEPAAVDASLERTSRISKYGSTREFAFALVNSLASRYQAQQVSFGIRAGVNISVLAVSGKESFKASSPGIIDIQQAMEETLDAGLTIAFQPYGQSPNVNSLPVHKQWSTSTRNAVCSIPLMAGDDCIAVVSLQRDTNVGFNEAEISDLEQVIQPFGPAIELAQRGERTLRQHVRESATSIWRAIRAPQSLMGRTARMVVIAAGLIFLLGWFPYRPMTPCVIVPASLTQTLAPFDVQLADVMVRSGDRVVAGQTLVRFETREMELERAKLASQREQAEVDVRTALVAGDAAAASLAKANAVVFQRQLESIENKISLCTIVAPSDGMVVDAELDRKLGQVFAQGTPVLSFAPMDQFQLEIRVPEYQARHIRVYQSGCFVTVADPNTSLEYTIESIAGSAELIDGKNVFVAKANLDGSSEHFRQGMEGYAATSIGWKPIPWIAFHRLYEYACANFWL